MKTIEIAQRQWQEFCDRVCKIAADAMIRIEHLRSDGTTEVLADSVPLRRVVLDEKSDACNSQLVIETGPPGESPSSHVVVEPIRIVLRNERPEDRYHTMEVSAESGTTIIKFHPGLILEALTRSNADAQNAFSPMSRRK